MVKDHSWKQLFMLSLTWPYMWSALAKVGWNNARHFNVGAAAIGAEVECWVQCEQYSTPHQGGHFCLYTQLMATLLVNTLGTDPPPSYISRFVPCPCLPTLGPPHVHDTP